MWRFLSVLYLSAMLVKLGKLPCGSDKIEINDTSVARSIGAGIPQMDPEHAFVVQVFRKLGEGFVEMVSFRPVDGD